MSFDARIAQLGITLPDAPAPAANYVPYVQSGNLLFVSGQISAGPDGLIRGRLGDDMDADAGAAAARACGLALIAQARAALGSLDRIARVVKLTGFVNSTPDFTDQPEVVNGCSDLMVEVFGESGRHARAAVSAAALPRGVAVEVEAIFEIA
ncbi:Enamine deaminase RidA, house cleaning of reactive enamine intermediates, YjgF/YER057c/UK114 family [Paracoccus solventivorans]|uniref:Enamine deaminase RidA, house cleaning of reactive enamine intermediates, YjgF/YER057c/UK114 family n=1 Tax=Paracoccus solventivorans TaxID=53463 RepID=A0A1M7J1N5_9RHOB|nr:RidA family protein [Paracoccus solventivorans]SHM46802.1 Enamine deaminase RidA, house cleaning of reactive enamine intermediates, YjgF/YER057c/UK114 family [Paracoccus solventivorans]